MPKGPLTSLPTAPCTSATEGLVPLDVPHNPFGDYANSFKSPVADSCTPQMEATKLRPDHIRRSVAWSGLFSFAAHARRSSAVDPVSVAGTEINSEAIDECAKTFCTQP